MITDRWIIVICIIFAVLIVGLTVVFFVTPIEECTCSKNMLLEVRVHNLVQDISELKEEMKDFRQNDIFFRQFTEHITDNYINMRRKEW